MAITEDETAPRILIAGCGKLGGTIASHLAKEHTIYGLRRNPDRVPTGVHPVAADLLNPDQLRAVLPKELDLVIYCLTPVQYDESGYRDAFVTGLENLINAIGDQPVKRLIFISSSSVYSQDDDSWVDESSPTEPARASGQQILQGEQTALNSGFPATVVRFSGIYGPSRKRFLQAVMEGEMDPASPAPFSNRIHEADAAAAVCHLAEHALNGQALEPCYLASDSEPARLDEVVEWVRSQLPCKAPAAGARKGGRAGSKRCSNQKLLQSGFEFRYPNYRAGYGEMIDEQMKQQ
ncbi:NAD-dependent epimerase/dehydratase family protein [Marinobacter sp. CHS3-4]|uniref:NAD-dependent epimerase/dehydratase family protein n=1 Tax=Marinobacter sp. CHS3-4 TaxID=3045174 RepID=UPI0024B4970A|nr:NAD-dependent epimerase/dehydratase family protein [Marinobacter sp. CHS3-4]MDI9246555.1 NAD(P)H-binding protein [Marinobacter sp. CHS3-4]